MISTNHVFSAFSCLGFILVSIPFPWHLEAWNTGTCLYMFWVSISCLTFFINSVIWDANTVNWAPGWCDITTRVILGTNIAIPATALCIQRRLYRIVSDPAVIVTKAEKRRSVMVDSAIGLGLPLLNILLTYIVQGHRFDIFEDLGCYPAIINTPLTFVIIDVWPIVIGLFTGVYCALNIYHFWIKRRTMKSLLEASSGSINFSRYLRLMTLSGIDLLCTVPFAAWGWYLQGTMDPVIAWPGWKAAHANFSRVDQIPAVLWRSDASSVTSLELTRWSSVMCALIFFAFFGFADEAKRNYSLALMSVAKKIGYSTFTPEASNSFGTRGSKTYGRRAMSDVSFDDITLPVYDKDHRNPMSPKKDQFGTSFGSALTVSTNYEADSKQVPPSPTEESPVVPYTPIAAPAASFGTDPRRGVRPPVMRMPLGGA
jgi:pheromone a factor receptor